MLLSCSHSDKNASLSQSVSNLTQKVLPVVWSSRGRIAVIDGNENWYAHFVWQQKNNDYLLRFTGPMGQTQLLVEHIAKSEQSAESNRLVMSAEEYENSNSMQALLEQYSPLQIPLHSLKYWMFGKANLNHTLEQEKDKAGNLVKLFQHGWQINFSRYESISGAMYPAKITAKKAAYKIKLFISSREIQQ